MRGVGRDESEVEILSAEREVLRTGHRAVLHGLPDELVDLQEGLVPGCDLVGERRLGRPGNIAAENLERILEIVGRGLECGTARAFVEEIRVLRHSELRSAGPDHLAGGDPPPVRSVTV
jgi:hypothetical protein